MSFNVAIDGPAGAGKSTIAKGVAKNCQFIYVDTGAMYRSIGLYILRKGISIYDEERVSEELPNILVTIGYEDGAQQVYLNGENVSGLIRTQEVSEAASVTSQYKKVRAHLLDLQRDLASKKDVLMDGRDIGTQVLPNADLKIFLTASAEVRADRRYKELIEKGTDCNYEEILKEIKERDYRDSHREVAPLKQAEDAILIDSSDMTIEDVTEKIMNLIAEKRK